MASANWCQCEHVAHTSEGMKALETTPNGNAGHPYGETDENAQLVDIKTTWGTFTVCKDCAEDCHHPRHGFREED